MFNCLSRFTMNDLMEAAEDAIAVATHWIGPYIMDVLNTISSRLDDLMFKWDFIHRLMSASNRPNGLKLDRLGTSYLYR